MNQSIQTVPIEYFVTLISDDAPSTLNLRETTQNGVLEDEDASLINGKLFGTKKTRSEILNNRLD